jgi:small subunit ribosomal protein S20
MPLLKASKKALRTSRRAQTRNALQARRLKEALKDADEKSINKTYSTIDKAAKRGIIHKNKAARLKSRLAKKIGSTPKKTSAKSDK